MEYKGIIKMAAAFAVGAAVTYAAIDKEVVQTSALPSSELCAKSLAQNMEFMEKTYADVPATPGIATPQDLSIDYVVSPETSFKGLVFEDKASGKYGVITKQEVLGSISYTMKFTELETVLQKAENVSLDNGVKVYSSAKEEVSKK
jgi:hypothetical protein